jgi:arylsulfatase
MFKRYTYQGGVCDPLVISWPKGISARGEVRGQYHHSTDIMPTILEACGVPMPEVVNGVRQSPLAGVSMAYTFGDATAPTRKETQYYEMLGSRGIWHKGWKAVTEHGPTLGKGHFEDDRWQLFHTDEDRSEATDVAAQYPERVEELKRLWMDEAIRNNVLPLNDMTPVELGTSGILYRVPVPASGQYTYYPGTSEVPEQLAANTHGSFKILAEVTFAADTQGVIVAQGSRFGGYSLFVKGGTLTYVYNFLGVPPEQTLVAPAPKGGTHIVGVEFTKERMGEHHEILGTARLHIDGETVAQQEIRTIPAFYSLCGEGLCVGYDSGDAVSSQYTPKFAFSGGEIVKVVFDVAGDAYIDLEQQMAAAMARD